jgi:hypothetical protein
MVTAQVTPPFAQGPGVLVVPLVLGLILCAILLVAKLADMCARQWNHRPSYRTAVALLSVDAAALLFLLVGRHPVLLVLAVVPLIVTVGVGATMSGRAGPLGRLTSAVAGAAVLAAVYLPAVSARGWEFVSAARPVGAAAIIIVCGLWVALGVVGWMQYLRGTAPAA